MELISFKNYNFCYALGNKLALSNVNFSVTEGDFVVIFGSSGSGKSTLLRCIKEDVIPVGEASGTLETNLESHSIAMVFQDPNTQLVCHSVLEDLVFYMENLGYKQEEMKKRLAETVHYFGLESLLSKNPNELSGGQKQLLVLCAALMTRPKLLLLDEPVSQLDPIAVREFFSILSRVNEDFKVTIVMSEHRLDEAITVADKLMYMKNGEIIKYNQTKQVLKSMIVEENGLLFVPSIPRVSYALGQEDVCISPKELKESNKEHTIQATTKENPIIIGSNKALISLNKLFFAYDKGLEFIIKDLSLTLHQQERLCLLGGNGSGKSTLLKIIATILKPSFGRYKKGKIKIGYMPQDLKLFFRFLTVREEAMFGNKEIDYKRLRLLGLEDCLDRHPFDLSGGEASKLALYCILSQKPDILLLDEPTKGLDPYGKEILSKLLIESKVTVICATHDLEFAVKFSTRCSMLFDGSIAFSDAPKDFFRSNQYYTTPMHLATRHFNPNLFTVEDVIQK